MNIYNEFKNIENRLSGKEPTIHGGTYYFAVDRLDKSDDIILSLKDYFLKLEAVNEEDEIILSVINNPDEDIKKICNDWHIEEVLTDRLSELISTSQGYYRVCEDYRYLSRGNCGEIFRIIETDNELIILDFYITD